MSAVADQQQGTTARPLARWGWLAAGLVTVIGAVAWCRVGALGLPPAPPGLTLEQTGVANLDQLQRLDRYVRGDDAVDDASLQDVGASTREAARLTREGLVLARGSDPASGLALMRQGVRRDPSDLVFANAYRMIVFQLRREHLRSADETNELTPHFPKYLEHQPITFFEQLAKTAPCREVRLQLALAWVDEMLLFPALEIKAPASVESVKILTEIIDDGHPGYVPALFARGLNHLHRPARLVWPETDKTRLDAAAQDIGLCVSIGRQFHVGSKRLQARLAITLGDAYVKAGRFGVARSWWQIAQNLCKDADLQEAVRLRYTWRDEELVDRLEEQLDRARSHLAVPMTDLALMWN